MTNYWLMKSEPLSYSIDDMQRDGRECWEGVRNYQARNFMRDEMKVGDLAIFYHSNVRPPGAAGIMKVCKEAYPDDTMWDPESMYFDPKSSPENPRWLMVDLEFVEKFPYFVSLDDIKREDSLKDMILLRKGMRLSIQKVEKYHFEKIRQMGVSS